MAPQPPPHRMILQLVLFFFITPFLLSSSYADPPDYSSPQSQTLWQIKNLLLGFNIHIDDSGTVDFCNAAITATADTAAPPPSLTVACYQNNITQLHITGGPATNITEVPAGSFFPGLAAIPALSNLRVLSLVSLGLRGNLPGAVIAASLPSLEILNLTGNHLDGGIPAELSSLRDLRTLVLDHNRFTGQVPDWLPQLPLLTVVGLRDNSLSGPLPDSLSRMPDSLRVLVLAANRLSGDLPPGLANLTNLQILDVEGNLLGPHFPGLPERLLTLVLRNNKFRFGIPSADRLRSFYQLQKMDLSANDFTGPFSQSILSLPSLAYLDISDNKFTGMLSEDAPCSGELVFVNISSNRLTGELPGCLRRRISVADYAENCLSRADGQRDPREPVCHNQALAVKIEPRGGKKDGSHSAGASSREHRRAIIASSIVGGIALLSVALFAVARKREILFMMKSAPNEATQIIEKVQPPYTVKMLTDARYISETMKLAPLGIPTYRTFVYEELAEATNNFDVAYLLGDGCHGQLYKGQLNDGSVVAVRNMKLRKKCSMTTYTRHIEQISKLRHPHLASAVGHCLRCSSPEDSSISAIYLVFEFVPNGNLRSFLSAGQKFTWTQRLGAAIGVAKGIQFLHTGIAPPVVSNNLKITDVLLDHNFHVKISGYNLPLLADARGPVGGGVSVNESKRSLQRRFNYEDHNDVYDFGVILLEMILGREINSENDAVLGKDLLQVSLAADELGRRSIIDPAIHKECSDESLKALMDLCVRCLSIDHRFPSIDDVLWNLQFVAQVQDSVIGSPASVV